MHPTKYRQTRDDALLISSTNTANTTACTTSMSETICAFKNNPQRIPMWPLRGAMTLINDHLNWNSRATKNVHNRTNTNWTIQTDRQTDRQRYRRSAMRKAASYKQPRCLTVIESPTLLRLMQRVCRWRLVKSSFRLFLFERKTKQHAL